MLIFRTYLFIYAFKLHTLICRLLSFSFIFEIVSSRYITLAFMFAQLFPLFVEIQLSTPNDVDRTWFTRSNRITSENEESDS